MARIRASGLVAVVALLLGVAAAARVADDPEQQFETFCIQWMEKLAARERDNVKQIQWLANGGGVKGEYIGYSREHRCEVKPHPEPKAVPIGKIIYQEIRYQKQGDSRAVAEAAPPRAIEATEVTEIFRYAKGKWEY